MKGEPMWTKDFWKAVAERTISTAAESLLGVISMAVILQAVDWPYALGVAGVATLASVLKCLIRKPSEVTAKEDLATYTTKRLGEDG
jgi:hypothetical protein